MKKLTNIVNPIVTRILFTCLIFSSLQIGATFAQHSTIILSDCADSDWAGTYTFSQEIVTDASILSLGYDQSCGCWENDGNSNFIVISTPGIGAWILVEMDNGLCSGNRLGTAGLLGIALNDGDCDISDETISGSNCMNISVGPQIAPIPTLSQWALFILGLCITTLAVVTIRNRVLVVN